MAAFGFVFLFLLFCMVLFPVVYLVVSPTGRRMLWYVFLGSGCLLLLSCAAALVNSWVPPLRIEWVQHQNEGSNVLSQAEFPEVPKDNVPTIQVMQTEVAEVEEEPAELAPSDPAAANEQPTDVSPEELKQVFSDALVEGSKQIQEAILASQIQQIEQVQQRLEQWIGEQDLETLRNLFDQTPQIIVIPFSTHLSLVKGALQQSKQYLAINTSDLHAKPAVVQEGSAQPMSQPTRPQLRSQAADASPSWINDPPRRIGNVYRQVVSAGPYVTRQECEENLTPLIVQAAQDYLYNLVQQTYGKQPSIPPLAELGLQLRHELVVDQHYETVHSSVSDNMQTLHAQLELDAQIEERLLNAWRGYLRHDRTMTVAAAGGGVLMLMAGAWAILRRHTGPTPCGFDSPLVE